LHSFEEAGIMTAFMNAVIRINEKERQIKKTRKVQKNSVGVNFSCESFFFLDFSNLKRKRNFNI